MKSRHFGYWIGIGFLFTVNLNHAQNIAITDNDSYTAETAAMLDVYSTNKGMLVPRIALISASSPISATKPSGLLVYNTSTTGTYSTPGFYYWNGSDWTMVGTNSFTFTNGITQSGKTVKLGGVLTENTTLTLGNYNSIFNLTGTGVFNVQNNGTATLLVNASSNVGIGTAAPVSAAILDVTSTTKGILVPRMTTTQRNVISSPTNGLLVYDTSYGSFFYYNGTKSKWTMIPSMPTTTSGMTEALFAVLNQNGDTVFAVYPEGVQIHVGDGVAKGNKGGFAVANIGAGTKATGNEYFRITPDSIRMYIENDAIKGNKGGFAVANIGAGTKGKTTELLRVTDDSVRIYIEESAKKGNKGGFAVANIGAGTKSSGNEYIQMTKDNYFIGLDAGAAITTGLYNSFLGYQSGMKTKEGADNVFIGYQSGLSNIGGLRNVFIGKYSGMQNTSGYDNVFLGHRAGEFNTQGICNVFLGERAGWYNTLGERNIFVGAQAGTNNTDGDRNIMIGDSAGFSNLTGLNNIFLGTYAGATDTKGYQNVYIGYKAGMNALSQSGLLVNYLNVVIGGLAGMNLNGSNGCTFVGNNSGYNSTTVSACSFFGAGTGKANTTGVDNTFLGYQSGFTNSIGYHNTYVGSLAGYSGTGNDNAIVGYQAGYRNASGAGNAYLGTGAGYNGTSGSNNSFLGFQSGYNSTGSNNVYLGFDAGQSSSTGNNNVFLGDYSGYSCTGSGNVFLGSGTGQNTGSISSNVFIGFQAGQNETGNNKLYIDNSNSSSPLVYGDFSSDILTVYGSLGINTNSPAYDIGLAGTAAKSIGMGRRLITLGVGYDLSILAGGATSGSLNKSGGDLMLISGISTGTGSSGITFQTATAGATGTADNTPSTKMTLTGDGYLGIGTTAPSQYLDVNGNARFRSVGSGTYSSPLNITSTGILTTATSDGRLKENIKPLTNSLAKIIQLQGVNFSWRADSLHSQKIGFIAQDVEKVLPELVFTNPVDGYKGINYAEITAVLTEAVKEQQKQIETLTRDNQELKKQLENYSALSNEIEKIKAELKGK